MSARPPRGLSQSADLHDLDKRLHSADIDRTHGIAC